MKTIDFDYHLPPELVAQAPVEPRDRSRLLVLNRKDGSLEHRYFHEIGEYLRAGDLLVCNNSRVIPARLWGRKAGAGAKMEILLLRRLEHGVWEALAKPGRRLKEGAVIDVQSSMPFQARVVRKTESGSFVFSFSDGDAVEKAGSVPLPPYIHAALSDPERYQTVYSRNEGSVAAPTAGLHFTPELINSLRGKGVRFAFVCLHLGLGSFRPVKTDDPREHVFHHEFCELDAEAAAELNSARSEGRRIICVGTSSVRTVEQIARTNGSYIHPFSGWNDLFVLPGHRFQMADCMVTNFHLPKSTLLMLVSAFTGRELILRAYEEATKLNYRFYSFGDAMLII